MANRKQGTAQVAGLMKDLDLCMLTTRASDGALHTRPMSNNGEVEFDGDLWFFANRDSRKVREIEKDARVSVSFADADRGLWLAVEGQGSIVKDVATKKKLWFEELEQWFDEGPEGESVVLIKVNAERAERWGSAGDGVIELD